MTIVMENTFMHILTTYSYMKSFETGMNRLLCRVWAAVFTLTVYHSGLSLLCQNLVLWMMVGNSSVLHLRNGQWEQVQVVGGQVHPPHWQLVACLQDLLKMCGRCWLQWAQLGCSKIFLCILFFHAANHASVVSIDIVTRKNICSAFFSMTS